ncbi:DMT family transporter [Candidatus Tokpelaia sp.]|uniref:DMT family transporter n=1 Tax=Candidatus Tokpelaia sp. TaxID=2233777 RepID=UPI00123AAD7B|nr:DMT family transporter [Candidatus Tokpelaia sp.]KAA6405878.1 EamA/RhaT family transporter [Candidatus Tokpelaia sp.]
MKKTKYSEKSNIKLIKSAKAAGPAPKPDKDSIICPAAVEKLEAEGKTRYGLGIILVIIATFIFAWQDAVTKTLVNHYPISFIVLIRGWIFLAAGLAFLAFSGRGGIKANIKTKRPVLQVFRGLLVTCQWLAAGVGVHYLGLAESTALYEAYPLFGTVLAIFILHEQVGWRRICGVIIGFIGILIMVRPGAGIMSGGALYALAGAFIFAVYMVLTRLVAGSDQPPTSFFYMGAVPAVVMTLAAPYVWVDMAAKDIWLFALLGLFAVSAHFCMIKALTLAPVAILQPFNYFQLVWSIFVGLAVFGDLPDKYVFIGAALVVLSGLFVLYRGQVRKPRIFVEAKADS